MTKIVQIYWVDSGGLDGHVWDFKDSYDLKLHECQTVGYLVEQTKERVVVAQSNNPDQWGRLFVIPRGAITAMVALSPQVKPRSAKRTDAKSAELKQEEQ